MFFYDFFIIIIIIVSCMSKRNIGEGALESLKKRAKPDSMLRPSQLRYVKVVGGIITRPVATVLSNLIDSEGFYKTSIDKRMKDHVVSLTHGRLFGLKPIPIQSMLDDLGLSYERSLDGNYTVHDIDPETAARICAQKKTLEKQRRLEVRSFALTTVDGMLDVACEEVTRTFQVFELLRSFMSYHDGYGGGGGGDVEK